MIVTPWLLVHVQMTTMKVEVNKVWHYLPKNDYEDDDDDDALVALNKQW